MLMVLVAVILAVIIIFIIADTKKPSNYPPGPKWLPIVGNYPLLKHELLRLHHHHLVWMYFAAHYGPVVGLRLGRDLIILISGYHTIRCALSKDEFDGRPEGFFFRLRTFNQRLGIVFTDGPLWQEQRKFSLNRLRNFGLGKSSMETQIQVEAEELVLSLKKKCTDGKPVSMHDAFDVGVLNSLWTMIAGERFDVDDVRLAELMDIVHDSFRMLDMSGGLLNQMPFLRFIAPNGSGYNRLAEILQRMWSFLQETITEHKKTFTMDHTRDLIDSFLHEMEVQKEDTHSTFTEKQLLSLCLDLFMAGSETTSNTLAYAVFYMLINQDIQLRVQEEMDSVIGRDRQPELKDRSRLTYVEAVLMEIQRHSNVAPVAVAHRAMKSTHFMGYTVPEGATLLISLWSVHMDPSHWGDPEVFRPDRFLNPDGSVIQDEWFMPFGIGKRRCLGEILARSSLFLFFTTLLHNFHITVTEGEKPPKMEAYDGVTLSLKPFHALLTQR